MQTRNISWHSSNIKNVEEHLASNLKKGLTEKEAEDRLDKYGLNFVSREEGLSFLSKIWKQVKSPLVFVLVVAGLVTLFLGHFADAIVISIVVVINTGIGFYQEEKSSNIFQKLLESQQKFSTIIRSDSKKVIPVEQIVPGDLVLLSGGDYVPADGRIVSDKNFVVNESILTGEWVSVLKDTKTIDPRARITDRYNMVFMGTMAVGGQARVLVTGTGKNTELGKIADSVSEFEGQATPLQRGIKKIARGLAGIVLFFLVLIFIVGILRGESAGDMLFVSIAVAVAAVPSGLPVAVTVVLAIGLEAILKKGGLIKNLLAAETLGSTTVILTDKTGTLTKAEIQVGSVLPLAGHSNTEVLKTGVMASDAFVEEGKEEGLKEIVVNGRPIEKAVLIAGIESGIDQDKLFLDREKIDHFPFSPDYRFAASLNRDKKTGKFYVYISGAPEALMDENPKYGAVETKIYEDEAKKGMRMIAVGRREVSWSSFNGKSANEIISNVEIMGFLGLHDPLREDAKESIMKSIAAGAKVRILTGDNAVTAKKIAIEIGLMREGDEVISGEDLEGLEHKQIFELVKVHKVFARMLPEQKLLILNTLKKEGEVVAMTGDGVNDAPALKHADIGIALGSGTDAAKEASDLILVNNSFKIIVDAIEEGRRIMDNLKKIVAYLLSTGFSEIVLVGGSLAVGFPLPILPSQILWTNIVEEGFMTVAFAFEPKEKGLMHRNPRSVEAREILTKKMKTLVFFMSVVSGLIALVSYILLYKYSGLSIEKVRTIMFAIVASDSLFLAISLKNLKRSVIEISPFTNKYLLWALALSVTAIFVAFLVPPLALILSLEGLILIEIGIVLGLGLLNLFAIEIVKFFIFRNSLKSDKI